MRHPDSMRCDRRMLLEAGAVGLLGLGSNHLAALRAAEGQPPRAKSVIFIFLSGGLSQLDSFDMKPNGPQETRGDFAPIATKTPGVQICEHLPQLARRSDMWSLVRSLSHSSNSHEHAHTIMLTGRSALPPGYDPNKSKSTDWPSITATAGEAVKLAGLTAANNLPPAAILPELLRATPTLLRPGQLAGTMGSRRKPWIVEASPFRGEDSYGAYPTHTFHHHREEATVDNSPFEAPSLKLPEGLSHGRFNKRMDLLKSIDGQRASLERQAQVTQFDRYRQASISLLSDPRVRSALEVTRANQKVQARYGCNSFGWSLLMAKRLVEIGVNLVQVNLGGWSTWDTHGSNFLKLKDFLLPPTDLAVSGLLDDLQESGLLSETLVVVASEFGRTPKIFNCCKDVYSRPGRDHWGALQTVFLAGGGVVGGRVIGASDRQGAYPTADVQTPEDFAATIYDALGIPRTTHWQDALGRPHQIYFGQPIPGLT